MIQWGSELQTTEIQIVESCPNLQMDQLASEDQMKIMLADIWIPYNLAVIWKYTAKLITLWYDNFGENHTPLQRNGMAATPKMMSRTIRS